MILQSLTVIKLILMDVDGTLTDSRRAISTKAIEAMRMAQDNGLKVSLVSGNVIPVMYSLTVFIGLEAPVFGENGGVMIDDTGVRSFFGIEKPRKLLERLLEEGLATDLITNQWRYCSMGYGPTGKDNARIRKMAQDSGVEITNSGFSWHILNPGQNKGFALKWLMDHYSIRENEAMVIGDNFNDLPMFMDKVVKGAPANAEKELREISDIVSEIPYGEGTADLILRVLSDKI